VAQYLARNTSTALERNLLSAGVSLGWALTLSTALSTLDGHFVCVGLFLSEFGPTLSCTMHVFPTKHSSDIVRTLLVAQPLILISRWLQLYTSSLTTSPVTVFSPTHWTSARAAPTHSLKISAQLLSGSTQSRHWGRRKKTRSAEFWRRMSCVASQVFSRFSRY